jgi:DNA excision repair protein ERCC-6
LSDLYDLFTFTPGESAANQRSAIFQGAEVEISGREGGSSKDKKSQTNGLAKEKDVESSALSKMDGVATLEEFKEDPSVHDEKRMLDGIFARNVGSAYDHEQIVNGKQNVKPDIEVLRKAAKEESREAVAHLRRAGAQADSMPAGTVTWTGEVGHRPGSNRRRGGPSSAGVMNNLAGRQGLNSSEGINKNMKAKDFVPMIKEFINRQGGKVVTKMLVDHFSPYCKGKKQNEEFERALKSVAEISQRGSYGRAMWSLKKGGN